MKGCGLFDTEPPPCLPGSSGFRLHRDLTKPLSTPRRVKAVDEHPCVQGAGEHRGDLMPAFKEHIN